MCSSHQGRNSLAAHEDHGEAGCLPAAQWSTKEQVGVLEGACDSMGSPHWSRLLAGPRRPVERSPHWSRFVGRTCDPEGDPCWSSLFLKDYTPWKRHTLQQFMKNYSLQEGPVLEKFVEDFFPWVGPHTGAVKECEEEGMAETKCDELTQSPFPVPLCHVE